MLQNKIIGLKSDFRDYYDHWFAGSWQKPDVVFERYIRSKTSRREDFEKLKSMGLRVPVYGTVTEVWEWVRGDFRGLDENKLSKVFSVVVYTDEHAHAGEGKLLLSFEEALEKYPSAFASEYIPATAAGVGITLRYLRVGLRQFWLRYSSYSDWRSNCGDVKIELLCEEKIADVAGPAPLYAVDFIKTEGKLVALDYNTSPGLRGTGVEALMGPEQAYRQIVSSQSRCEIDAMLEQGGSH